MNSKRWLTCASTLFVLAMLAACGGGGGDGSTAAPSPDNSAPPPDNVAGFAYVTNGGSNDVSAYSINATTGGLSEVAGSPFATKSFPTSVVVDPSGKFAYVANSGSCCITIIPSNISAYTINATTGALSEIAGSPFLVVGREARDIAIHPTGRFVYVTGNEDGGEDGDVFTYAVNTTTGALTRVGAGAFAGFLPLSATVHPSGNFVYWVSYLSPAVWGYTIDATTGALTRIGTGTFDTGLDPRSISVHPAGRFAYVTTQSNIWVYSVDTTTGALSEVAGSPFGAGDSPDFVTVDPSGKFAYVANGGDTVSAFSINATTGALSEITGSPFAVGSGTGSVAFDPSGKFAYVTHSNDRSVSAYTINATTGALTSIGTTAATGIGPFSITTTRKIR